MILTPGEISTKDLHAHLMSSIAPRPICFASTIDENGVPNLAPFSFFNIFGSNPPILVFSPSRRVRDNTTKHTLQNCIKTGEVVINIVNYSMVQQVSLSSCEYPESVNEFEKAGFTMLPADLVKPFIVRESPVSLECKVLEVKNTGDKGGAGNLIICEIIKMHIKDEILDEDGTINPHKIDVVGRMGKDYYCRASGDAVFEVPKPNLNLGIGFDKLPEEIRNSSVLTGNDLGMLANVSEIPLIKTVQVNQRIKDILERYNNDQRALRDAMHHYAKELLHEKKVMEAWNVLLSLSE